MRASDGDYEDRVLVQWESAATRAVMFKIFRNGTAFTTVVGTARSVEDFDLPSGGSHTYCVSAVTADEVESARTCDTGFRTLASPGDVAASDDLEAHVLVNWTDRSSVETGYRIERQDPDDPGFVVIGTRGPNRTAYMDSTSVPGRVYEYRVSATDARGVSAGVSDTGSRHLAAPGSVAATDGAFEDRIVVTWTDRSTAESGYAIHRTSPQSGTQLAGTAPRNATSFTDPGVVFGRAYTYSVTAVDALGGSPAGSDAGHTTIRPPASVRASDTYATHAGVVWVDASAIEQGYRVYRDGTLIATTAANATSYNDSAAAPGAHRYCVVSFSAAAVSDSACDDGFVGTFPSSVFTRVVPAEPGVQYDAVAFSGDLGVAVKPSNHFVFLRKDSGRWIEEQEIFDSVSPHFVAIDGERAVLGRHIYHRSGNAWTFSASMITGGSVDIRGDYAAIGAGVSPGQVHIYFWNGSSWGLQQTISSPGPTSFGGALAIDGRTLVVGTPNETNNTAYIYGRNGTTWTLQATFPGTNGWAFAVDVDGPTVMVGNQFNFSGDGVPFVNVYTQSGGSWTLSEVIRELDRTPSSRFGRDIALRGDVALIGARASTGGGGYLFHRRGGAWSQIARLRAGTDGSFITGVTLSGASGALNDNGAFHPFDLLLPAAEVAASDGDFDQKVQIRWKDPSTDEEGFRIYRDGLLIETVSAGVQSYSDFEGEPGRVYEYCVRSFNTLAGETGPVCDFGRRPPDGAITGRVATRSGAGVEHVEVCLDPSPTSALQLDGASGHVRVDSLGRDALTELTVECWVRTADPRTGTLFSYHSGAFQNALTVFNTANLTLFINDLARGTAASVIDNQWHHVAFTWRNSDGRVQLVRDGVLVHSSAGFQTGGTIAPGGILILGQEQDSPGAGFEVGQALQGQLDDVRLWNVAREASDIAADRTRLLDPGTPGLVLYMPFDEGVGTEAADLGPTARYGTLTQGAFWSSEPAPLSVCGITDLEGNYALSGIRYGASTTFQVTPRLGPHQFEPAFKSITLAPGNPVQNEIAFNDVSSFTLSGTVWFAGTTCPVEGAEVRVDGVVVGTTGADGRYAVAAGFGPHTLEIRKGDHVFAPPSMALDVQQDRGALDFQDGTLRRLTGLVGGGCRLPIGTVHLEVRTESGCLVTTTSTDDNYRLTLPPQKYFVRVTDVTGVPSVLDRADILEFFEILGPRIVDLTDADQAQDFVYRAPLVVAISGFDPPSCPTLTLPDGVEVPSVPILAQGDQVPLTIEVYEDYGDGNHCPVDSGTVTIFDEIIDEQDTPVELVIENGRVLYTTAANTPNVFSGRIDSGGNNRSFQKPISAVAQVEGLAAVRATEWVVVTGHRPRTATFTSVSQEVPLLVLRDPPGDGSAAFLERGTKFCTQIRDFGLQSLSTGIITKAKGGVRFSKGTPFWSSETEIGLETENNFKIGFEATQEGGVQICSETLERFSTSTDDSWLGGDGDVFMGVAMNLVFAKTDVLDFSGCRLDRSESITMGGEGFETTYLYTAQHIRDVLIPQLEELAVHQPADSFYYRSSAQNWRNHLALNDSLKTQATFKQNRSFSAGADFEYSQTSERTGSFAWTVKAFTSNELALGFVFNETGSGVSNQFAVNLAFEYEHGETRDTTTTTTTGYTLVDDDIYDFFSVNIHEDTRYATPVFHTVSGRSSCPWEPATQPRDGVQIRIEPPIQTDVDPDGLARFVLSVTNVSEADEQREYFIQPVQTTNADGTSIFLVGDTFLQLAVFLEPGQTHTWEMTVARGPSKFRYENIGITAIATCQFDYWRKTGVVQLADTAFFSVHYRAPCSDITLFEPRPGWTYNLAQSQAAPENRVRLTLKDFELDISETESIEVIGAEYRAVDTDVWYPIQEVPRGSLEAGRSVEILWNVAAVPDGKYELRAFTRCASGRNYSGSATGVIDRSAPQAFGTPQPSDGTLSFGEDISITFDEDIVCASAAAGVRLETTAGSPQALGVRATCNGRTVILQPTVDLSAYEGQVLRATVTGVRDKAGNPFGTRAWTFTVRQSEFVWAEASLASDVGFGQGGLLTLNLVNGLGQPVVYSLSGLPPWLTALPASSDTIPARSQVAVAFEISTTVALGSYDASIVATASPVPSGSQRTATLDLHLNVLRVPPSWTVDPARFEHSMTVRAKVHVSGDSSAAPDDILAAFVGNEVRGIARPQLVSDGWRYFLTVYGRPPAFERVRFRVWDSRTSKTYIATDRTLKFVPDTAYGSFANPVQIRTRVPSPANEQVIAVNAGWTWFSVNRRPSTQDDRTVAAVLSNLVLSPGDLVKAQNGAIAMFDAVAGWVGTLDTLGVTASYRLKTAAAGEIRYESARLLPSLYPIPVVRGWNWIGYTPDDTRPVGSALTQLVSASGDLLRSQTAFAEFAPSSWSGSLAQMAPGQGFALYRSNPSPGQFTYDDVPASTLALEGGGMPFAATGSAPGHEVEASGWTVDAHAYPYDMVVAATIEGLALSSDWRVAAVVDGEVRGVARPVHVAALNRTLVFLMVRSHRDRGETVTFQALDRATGKIHGIDGEVAFVADAVLGSTAAPTVLRSRGVVIGSLMPERFELAASHPNPLQGRGPAVVSYAVASGTDVRIELFDLAGRRVRTLVEGWRAPGWYQVTIEPAGLSGGIYFYRMRAGSFSAARRLVVTR